MFTDSGYAPPVGSFRRPVPVPSEDPDASPTISVSVACSWLPYIRGALQQLLLQATWRTDDPAALALAQARASNLIALFQECSADVLPFSCPFDFSGGGNGGTIFGGRGEYVAGSGWHTTTQLSGINNFRALLVQFFFSPAFTCTSADMVYDLTKGAVLPAGFGNGMSLWNAGTFVAENTIDSSLDPDGSGKHRVVTLGSPTTIDEIDCEIVTDLGVPAILLGDGLLTNLLVDGIGAAPC